MAKVKTESFCLKEDGIHIETNGLRFRVSYEQESLPFDEAKKWCAERGGDMFSFEEGIFTAALLPKINKALKKAGNPLLDGWYWLNRGNPACAGYAYGIIVEGGFVSYIDKGYYNYVRAVFALE